jgi:hypothetical protein
MSITANERFVAQGHAKFFKQSEAQSCRMTVKRHTVLWSAARSEAPRRFAIRATQAYCYGSFLDAFVRMRCRRCALPPHHIEKLVDEFFCMVCNPALVELK